MQQCCNYLNMKWKKAQKSFHCTPTLVAFKCTHKSSFPVTELKSKSTHKPAWAQGKLSFLASVERCVIKNSLTDRLPHSSAVWVVTALCWHGSPSSSQAFFPFFCFRVGQREEWETAGPERCQTTINGWLRLSANHQGSTGHVSNSGSKVRS